MRVDAASGERRPGLDLGEPALRDSVLGALRGADPVLLAAHEGGLRPRKPPVLQAPALVQVLIKELKENYLKKV